MELTIVDVFAEQPLAGNQLAVVRNAHALSTQQMQDIAREMNFSETTFVIDETAERARVRIFTPDSELPFAGHPTLGTAWVLAGGQGTFTLDLDAGAVPVEFSNGMGWMTPPAVLLQDAFDAAAAAELIGLGVADLDPQYPPRLAEVGPSFVLIGLRGLRELGAARLNVDLHQQYVSEGVGVQCVYLFTSEAHPDTGSDFASRMFFYAGSAREDPATGSANTAFAAYLQDLNDEPRTVQVDQGVEMKRPSRLYLKLAQTNQVGGKVQLVLRGKLELPF